MQDCTKVALMLISKFAQPCTDNELITALRLTPHMEWDLSDEEWVARLH